MSNGVDFKKISLENRELLNSALAREDALREELDTARYLHAKQCCVFCNDTGNLRSVHAALQHRLTVAEQWAEHWREVSSEATCRAASLNDRVGGLKMLLDEILDSGEWYSSALEFHDHQGLEIGKKINAALKPAEEDDRHLQKIGFVRMNTKTDQPRISMADMHARYERKPCQEPQAHPTRCGCEDLSHDQ